MRTILSIILGVLMIVAVLPTTQATACPCDCAALQACYSSCKQNMPAPALVMFCDAGCLLACLNHTAD